MCACARVHAYMSGVAAVEKIRYLCNVAAKWALLTVKCIDAVAFALDRICRFWSCHCFHPVIMLRLHVLASPFCCAFSFTYNSAF